MRKSLVKSRDVPLKGVQKRHIMGGYHKALSTPYVGASGGNSVLRSRNVFKPYVSTAQVWQERRFTTDLANTMETAATNDSGGVNQSTTETVSEVVKDSSISVEESSLQEMIRPYEYLSTGSGEPDFPLKEKKKRKKRTSPKGKVTTVDSPPLMEVGETANEKGEKELSESKPKRKKRPKKEKKMEETIMNLSEGNSPPQAVQETNNASSARSATEEDSSQMIAAEENSATDVHKIAPEETKKEDVEDHSFIPIDVLKRFYPTSADAEIEKDKDLIRLSEDQSTMAAEATDNSPNRAVDKSLPKSKRVPLPSLPPKSSSTSSNTGSDSLSLAAASSQMLLSHYETEFEKSFINPFTGKMNKTTSQVGRALLALGFYPGEKNRLRLEWSPERYFKGFHQTLQKIQKKKKIKEADSITTEVVLEEMLKNLGKGAKDWQEQLAQLLKRKDWFSVMPSELESRYNALVNVYMPPKLDATPDPALADTVLTPDQQNVLLLAQRGYNIYVGGSAGTGKTVLLKAIYRQLCQLGLRVAMTATTGVAAVQLGGCTFHSAFNAPVGLSIGRLRAWDVAALRAVDVVIVDEVSLLNAVMLDTFNLEAQLARMNKLPFGGIQVILCGDFLQLSIEHTAGDSLSNSVPLFQSEAFKNFVQLRLVTPMRHAAGDPLLEMLTKLRRGVFDERTFAQLDRPIPNDATHITYIFPRRKEAKLLNEQKLEGLDTPSVHFVPQRGPLELTGHFTASAFIDFPVECTSLPSRDLVVLLVKEEILRICPAAQAINDLDCVVMPAKTEHVSMLLRVRHPDTKGRSSLYVPGAAALQPEQWRAVAEKVAAAVGGRLVNLFEEEPPNLIPLSVSMTLADMSSGESTESLAPLRLKLGCRVMINRNLSRTVSNGSVGVVEAFSPPEPHLFPLGNNNYNYRQIKDKLSFTSLPVVRLLSGEVVQIPPYSVAVGGSPLSYFYKHDVYTLPLQLGYSFTVHKVQGLTLQGTVVMDCDHFFDCPHLLYVGCSRVRRLEQLIVLNVKPSMVLVRRSALEFADQLRPAHDPVALLPPPSMPRALWVQNAAPRVLKVDE